MKRFSHLLVLMAAMLLSLPAWGGVRGDADGSGVVDVDDLNAVINIMVRKAAWADFPAADVNANGVVDIDDLNIVVNVMLHKDFGGDPPVDFKEFTVKGVSFKMVLVEGGTFTMGATAEQGSVVLNHEKPAHEVTLDNFMIGQTEVTQALWVAVMGSNPSWFKGNSNRPVEQVSWTACQTFITRLNALTGEHFRLPTEAEWEYAAHGGKLSKGYTYAGSNSIREVAWYYDNTYALGGDNYNYGTHAVATKAPNELGLYDMSGNVWEWCSDFYGSTYYSSSPSANPLGPDTGTGQRRVGRGGGWAFDAQFCRVSCRACTPAYWRTALGLRLALSLP